MATHRRIDEAVEAEIHDLATFGHSPAQIEREIHRRHGAARTPGLRTIQRIVKDDVPEDSRQRWSFSPATAGEDDRHVLEVIADLIVWSDGRRQDVSEAEAAAIIGIRRVAPDLAARYVYRLARFYMARGQAGRSTADLDHWLAFAPWRGEQARTTYEAAIEQGRVSRPGIDMSADELRAMLDRALPSAVFAALTGAADSTASPDDDQAVLEDAIARTLPRVRKLIEDSGGKDE